MKFKPGDRVKVEFEGLLVRKFHTATARAWEIKVGNRISTILVSEVECTLIEPEIVLDENDVTIVQVDPKNEHNMRSTFAKYPSNGDGDNSLWGSISHGWVDTAELVNWCRMYGYVQYPAVSND